MAATRRTYQAVLTRQDSVDRVRGCIPQIERVKGRVEILPTTTPGVVTVTLELPEPYTPDMFVPGLPFFET
jgi:hypothetical protein